jgi:alkanesulfonate monooxygenase
MPLLPVSTQPRSAKGQVNTGPFGETIGGATRPAKHVSAS